MAPDLNGARGELRLVLDQGGPQLLQRTAFDLTDALLRYAEACAERFKCRALLAEAAFADDLQLAVVEGAERGPQPLRTPLRVDRMADNFVGERHFRNQKIHPVR